MKFFYLLLLLFISISLKSQIIITTIAGGASPGYSGDGGPAVNAQLGGMYDCDPAFDNAGNMYICQNANNTIRKVDKNGIITTIAGTNGVAGYSGDGGPAANALLFHPTTMAVDNANNIYFVDRDRTIIRKIDPAGIITTVSGQTTSACGVGDGGPLNMAKFQSISAITFDKLNNLYISDIGCNTVRKVNSAGIITTIAGNGTSGFSGDGGQATLAQLAHPGKVGIDNAGNVYIPDANNHRVRKVNTAGIITTFAGTGIGGFGGSAIDPTKADFYYPGSVVIDSHGFIFIGEGSHLIRIIDPAGHLPFPLSGIPKAGYWGDGGPANDAIIDLTEGLISIDNNDNIYFANYPTAYAIRKITRCTTPTENQPPVNATVCISGNATFSVTATNATSYQWQENTGAGWTNLSDNTVYSGTATGSLAIIGANTGMHNYQYRCALINSCGTINSTPALLSVVTPRTPSINLPTTSTPICEGAPATFTASTTNAGTAPVYQWQKNGVNIGTNSISYTDNTLNSGDVITCQLTSNATCLATPAVTSNAISVTVTPNVVSSVTISPSANNICAGTPVTFTSSITNGGSAPDYTWFKNGANLFLNTPTYTDNALNDGDVILCALGSRLACVTSKVVSSTPVAMVVNPVVTPSVTIAAASPGGVCKNTPAVFTATAVNGGTAPLYQWKKNGAPVGTNSDNYTDNNVIDGDMISCTLTSNSSCIVTAVATSNSIKEVVNRDPVPALDKNKNICEGNARVLDAGNFYAYTWNTGETGRTITIHSTGTYSVTVTDKNGCTATDYVDITTVVPSPADFLPADTSKCSYGNISVKPTARFASYLWNTGSTEASISITKAGQYWLQVTDNNGCIGTDHIQVLPKDCLAGFFMPSAFTPNHDGKNDILKPVILGDVKNYQFRIFNRWGQLIFTSTDHTKGWDGSFNGIMQDGTFVWVCIYQFEGEPQVSRKGTFLLIR